MRSRWPAASPAVVQITIEASLMVEAIARTRIGATQYPGAVILARTWCTEVRGRCFSIRCVRDSLVGSSCNEMKPRFLARHPRLSRAVRGYEFEYRSTNALGGSVSCAVPVCVIHCENRIVDAETCSSIIVVRHETRVTPLAPKRAKQV